MTDLERALEQIAFARGYTQRLLNALDPADWFRIPPAGVSHVAWQVGHLTNAQYRLVLLRLRGEQPADKELFPEEFPRLFGINSKPEPDPALYPSADTIRAVFDRVHARVLEEVARCDPATLDQPINPPQSQAKTKLAVLFWCAAHEMVHAGQIGLLRRQLGHAPVW
jgi:uncharacterized damage-inducible protein DinB